MTGRGAGGRTGGERRAIVVASMLRPAGGTGVQSHVDALMRHAPAHEEADIRCVTPFDLPAAVTQAAFGPGRLIRPVSRPAWVWWHRLGHYRLLRVALRRAVAPGAGAIVYAQEPLAALAALDLRDAGRDVEVAMMIHFNGSQADEWAEMGFIARGGPLYRRMLDLDARVIPRVDRLISPSRFMLDAVRERVPRAAGLPGRVVPNCADVPVPAAEGPAGDLISIGSLEPRKNQRFLLDVLDRCHRAGRRYTLTIVGTGPDRGALRREADRLGLHNHVRLPGYMPRAAGLITRHRAYVHAAEMENFPVALVEALGSGRPVFARAVGGIPELVRDGVDGRLWTDGDPCAAAEVLMETFEDDAAMRAMGAAASSRHAADLAPSVVTPRLIAAMRGEPDRVDPEPAEPGDEDDAGRRSWSAGMRVEVSLTTGRRPIPPPTA